MKSKLMLRTGFSLLSFYSIGALAQVSPVMNPGFISCHIDYFYIDNNKAENLDFENNGAVLGTMSSKYNVAGDPNNSFHCQYFPYMGDNYNPVISQGGIVCTDQATQHTFYSLGALVPATGASYRLMPYSYNGQMMRFNSSQFTDSNMRTVQLGLKGYCYFQHSAFEFLTTDPFDPLQSFYLPTKQ